jgi:CheY-like chemotaxis protein
MFRKPVILCVDDAPSVLEGRKMLLEECGYRVLTATNGKEAVQAFVSNSIDLVLLDYHMPGMNGDAAASHLRSAKPDVPIALLSGDESLPAGVFQVVDCFIPKSEPIASFLEQVNYLICLRFLFQPLDALTTQNGVDDRTIEDSRPYNK